MKRTGTFLQLFIMLLCCAPALMSQENIGTPEEFNIFIHRYYMSPKPNLVPSAIAYYSATYSANKSSLPPIISFFNRVFSDNPGLKGEWRKVIDRQEQEIREFLLGAINTDSTAYLANKKTSAALNDMNWGAYFASGDDKYLANLLRATKHSSERKDLNLFLAGFSAEWSLSSNARQHESVLKYLLREQSRGEYRNTITELLNTDPADLRKKAIDIISQQKARGVW